MLLRVGILIRIQSLVRLQGNIKFVDIVDGVTVNRQVDELTGVTQVVVIRTPRARSSCR